MKINPPLKIQAKFANKSIHRLSYIAIGIAIALNTANAATTTLISKNINTLANKTSNTPALSFDGSKIAFASRSGKLVGDNNSQPNIYLKDIATQTVKRISINSSGVTGDRPSYAPTINADGNKIVFYSTSTNLVTNDTNDTSDIFLRDLNNNTTQLISITKSGVRSNKESAEGTISGDGTVVAFSSTSTTLTSLNANSVRQVYVKDLSTGDLELISVNNNGQAGDNDSFSPAVSNDGRYIAFISISSNLDGYAATNHYDIYLHDRLNKKTERISFTSTGALSNNHSGLPSISSDGRLVAYMSLADNLVFNDTNAQIDIFVYDRQTKTVERASSTSPSNGHSFSPKLSSNGRFVAFYSSASNYITNDTNGKDDLFVYDRYLKTTELLSVSSTGAQTVSNVDSSIALSGDGKVAAFASPDSTLVSGDTNAISDIFIRTRDPIANLKPFAKSVPVPSQECSNGGAYVTLDASQSYDLDMDTITASWSGPFGVVNGSIASVFVGYGSHQITLTVTDSLGNKDVKLVAVNVIDSVAPTITAEIDHTFEATNISGASHTVTFVANDSCEIINSSVSPSPLFYPLGTTNVTVGVVDNAGNSASDITRITVVDTTPPILTAPTDLLKEATNRLSAINIGNASATDIFPTTISNDSSGLFALGISSVIWQATDSNGNSSTAIQNVMVKDSTKPLLVIPGDITSEATQILSAVNIGVASATDIFNVTVTNNSPPLFPIGSTNVTWTAKDENNNATTAVQKISITDTTAPTMTLPGNVRQEATDILTPVSLGQATTNDVFSVSVSNDALAAYPLGDTTVNWSAADANGNTASAQQTVTIFDSTAPQIVSPADIVIEATALLSPVTLGDAVTTDIFSVNLTNDAPAAFALGSTSVIWNATDTSGNSSQATQTVLVKDTTSPVIKPIANIIKEATDILTAIDIGTTTATDIFDVTLTNNTPGAFPLGDTTVTWSASDTNGNASTLNQKITVTDSTAPILEVPLGITTEAVNTLTPVNIGTAKISDIFSITLTNDAPLQYPLGKTIVNWNAVDANNNSSTASQIINIIDTTPPVINAGGDIVLEAVSPNGSGFSPKYSVSDICNCGDIKIDISPALSSYKLGQHVITVTATDISGNSANDQMTLSVVDTTTPIMNIPSNITMEASSVLTPVNVGNATATDIFQVTIQNNSPQVFPLGTSTVVWTATDANGNQTTAVQSVTIVDTTAPMFDLVVHEPTKKKRHNHKMRHAATVTNINDLVDASPTVDIQVTSNGDHPRKHKHEEKDWEIKQVGDDWEIWVRAEKLKEKKMDRIYHIDVNITDFSANSHKESTDITILRHRSKSDKGDKNEKHDKQEKQEKHEKHEKHEKISDTDSKDKRD